MNLASAQSSKPADSESLCEADQFELKTWWFALRPIHFTGELPGNASLTMAKERQEMLGPEPLSGSNLRVS
jgi:hypothetical protein